MNQGQPLIVSKIAAGGQTTLSNNILAGKQGAKFAGGNVTLVRSGPIKTPTKIAPAPPQSAASVISSTSSIQSQPTSLLIKNAAGQVTMAALLQARPTGGNVTNVNPLSPQKFVLRPSTPGSVTSGQGMQKMGIYSHLRDFSQYISPIYLQRFTYFLFSFMSSPPS